MIVILIVPGRGLAQLAVDEILRVLLRVSPALRETSLFVPGRGIEPPRLIQAQVPKTCVYANFTTLAKNNTELRIYNSEFKAK